MAYNQSSYIVFAIFIDSLLHLFPTCIRPWPHSAKRKTEHPRRKPMLAIPKQQQQKLFEPLKSM